MSEERRIIHEITPLMGKDVLYIADRHKKEFTYPIHNHSVLSSTLWRMLRECAVS